MTKPNGLLLLVSWSALVLVAAGKLEVEASEADEERVKRSDDFPASQGELAKLAQTVSLQGAQITLLKNQVTQLQSSLQTARTQVGFYAYRSASRFTVTSSSTIIFDHVYTNNGNGFDTHSGTFTAPVSGYYAFFLTIRSYTDSTFYAYITVEGVSRAITYVRHNDILATCHLYYHLSKGQRVWPKSGSGTHDVYGSLYTHFTGFLVQADP